MADVLGSTVQKGTRQMNTVTNNLEPAAQPQVAQPQEAQQQPAAQPQETQPQEGEQQQEAQSQEAQPQEGQQAETPLEQRVAEEVMTRMQQNAQAQTNASEEPEDVAFEAQIQQQREELESQANEQVSQIDQKKAELYEKLENGDIQTNQYLAENERLNNQKSQIEREADRNIMNLDSQLNQHKSAIESQIQTDRSKYAQQHPEFVEMYNKGVISQAMQDPFVRNVYGDNPAAVFEMVKGQTLQKENEQLKTELATLREQQNQAVSQAASNPNSKVGTQTGGMHPTTNQNQPTGGDDPMLSAMRSVRSATGGPA